MPKKTLEHFTHPGHRLVERKAETEYTCDGCKTPGMGTSYRCDICSFNLHEYCGTCPENLSTFMHPHPLNLAVRKAQGSRQNKRICSVCGDEVEGLFYRCKDCEFDVHPLCTQLPPQLCHALHPPHPLRLESSSNLRDGWCAVCGGSAGNSWRYRCSVCGFDIHLDCILVSPADPNTTNRSVPPSAAGPNAPAYGAYAGFPPSGPAGYYPYMDPPYGAYGVPPPGYYPHYPSGQGYGASAFGVPPPGYYPSHPSGQGNGTNSSGRAGFKRIIYALVERLTVGVVCDLILGMGNM